VTSTLIRSMCLRPPRHVRSPSSACLGGLRHLGRASSPAAAGRFSRHCLFSRRLVGTVSDSPSSPAYTQHASLGPPGRHARLRHPGFASLRASGLRPSLASGQTQVPAPGALACVRPPVRVTPHGPQFLFPPQHITPRPSGSSLLPRFATPLRAPAAVLRLRLRYAAHGALRLCFARSLRPASPSASPLAGRDCV